MDAGKTVGRNATIGLGIVCIILTVGLIGAIANCNSIIDRKDFDIEYLRNQNSQLQASLGASEAAKLIGIVEARDVRPWFASPYLHVYGNVVNVGAYTATNPVLHVEALQGQVLVFNTTIFLGIISGSGFANYVDQQIPYLGKPLTSWHVWSQPVGIDWNWTA
jgi:hypothetical protein